MGSLEANSLLESLPARPPTPPRETANNTEAHAVAKPLAVQHSSAVESTSTSNVQTPPSIFTPESSIANSANPSRTRKRVGFSAQAEYKDPPKYRDGEQARRSSPPSASQPRPVKGILKPSVALNIQDPSTLTDPNNLLATANISDMLESTVKQLAGTDRDSKLDAYEMIVRSLQASNNLPDRIALRDKMSLFTHFIQRDVVARNSNDALDSILISKTLSLLETFLFFPAIASTIPSDFGTFIIDHCIRSFEDPTMPKDVTRRLMHVVAMQDFSQRVMTSERLRRLVNALHSMDGLARGKSIIISRTRIYARLIHQARSHMAAHTDWLNDLFTDMLSGVKEIRNAAIKLGSEAAFTYGKEKILSRKVLELLDASIEERTYIEWYHEQLLKMAKGPEKSSVPRIWSVVVLLIRIPIDRWRFFNEWLRLLQGCFNGSDNACNREANYAWNRFVYATHLDERSFNKMFSTLFKPLGSQLIKSNISDQKRETILGGLCNLYYYAFRPSTNPSNLDHYWDASVKPLTETLVPTKRAPEVVDEYLRRATSIMVGLLDSATPRIWKDDRIRDSPVAKPEELPMIDPKWVRHNAARVFKAISPIMDRHFCQLSDKTSAVYQLWRTLAGSVSFAASKEIKVSNDTATFISETFSLLLKHWQAGVPEGNVELARDLLRSTQQLIMTVVEGLGLLPFTEKTISLGRLSNFTPVATPSHKPGKNLGDTRSPLQHLFGLVCRLPPGVPDDEVYHEFLQAIFSPFLLASRSARARSDVASEILSAVPNWSPPASQYPYGPWAFASENLIASMNASQNSACSSGDAVLGQEYRSIVRLLDRGWKETPNLPWGHWHSLYAALSSRAAVEVGEGGRAMGVVEPVAKMLRDALPDNGLLPSHNNMRAAVELLSNATHPQDRQASEAARRRLWGTAVTGSRTASFDPFDHFYKLNSDLLCRLYDAGGETDLTELTVQLLKGITSFLARSNRQLELKTLSALEGGIALWVQDKQGLVSSRRGASLAESVKDLWAVTCKIVLSRDQPQLDKFEGLLCAAFESKHRQVVNLVAENWNRVFEHAENVQYPEHLKAVLLSSQNIVDIVLPGLETVEPSSESHNRSFVDSQDDLRAISLSSSRSTRRGPQPSAAALKQSSPPSHIASSFPEKRRADGTPKRTRSSNRSTPTSRPRHDDSQLHFVAVESSPAGQQESQLLTERQKEIRERQQGAAAIFPELRSSPRSKAGESSRKQSSKSRPVDPLAERQRNATPEPRTGYEDYVTSTPTPRRGQAIDIDIDDHDMTDPPSSPPEPRPFPLLPQIKSRSSSRGEIDDDWPLSSSPVGSPVLGHQPTTEAELPNMSLANATDQDTPQQITGDSQSGIDASFQTDVVPCSAPPEALVQNPIIAEEPRSDNDVFVDALSSPQQPKRQATGHARHNTGAKEDSFGISEGDEQSMMRFVVELDSRPDHQYIPMSDHPAESPPKKSEADGVLDCITVKEPPKEKRTRKSKSRSPNVSQTAKDVEEPVVANAEMSDRGGKKKRKRTTSSKQERRKKRKATETKDAGEDESASVLNSSQSSVESEPSSPVSGWPGDSPEQELPDIVPETQGYSDTSVAPKEAQASSSPEQKDITSPNKAAGAPSPARRLSKGSEDKDTDSEIESQLITEQEAASQGQNEAAAEATVAPAALEEEEEESNQAGDAMDVDPAAAAIASPVPSRLEEEHSLPTPTEEPAEEAPQPQRQESTTGEPAEDKNKDVPMLDSLSGVLAQLKTASLSRDEVYKMEDVLMDIKRELFAAERRGRE